MPKKTKTKETRQVQLDSFQTFKARFAKARTHENATWLGSATHWMMYFDIGDPKEVAAVLRDLADFWETSHAT